MNWLGRDCVKCIKWMQQQQEDTHEKKTTEEGWSRNVLKIFYWIFPTYTANWVH